MKNLQPPIELITSSQIGIHDPEHVMEEYDRISKFLFTTIKNRAKVDPESDILDMGCGLGRVAAPFVDFLTSGSYTGVDVVKSSIDWCKETYKPYKNFSFIHADLFSEYYNPNAKVKAEEYKFPFDNGAFDVIWSSSLFTHMLIDAVDNYLSEMARVLKPGGRIWNSYLLLDEYSEPLVLGPRNDGRRMQYEVKGGRIGYKDKPEHVVGLNKEEILNLHERNGFEVTELSLSNWSGGRPGVEYKGQDIIIAKKK